MFLQASQYILYIIKPILRLISNIENKYLQMTSINVILNQLLFFTMCDITLCGHEQKKITALIGLNSLLFYYIITYFVQRIIDIISKMRPNTSNQRSSTSSLMLCIFKIVLEWSKAVIVIICLKEQGLKPHPHFLYSIITFLYYFATEPVYRNVFLALLNCLDFEGIEELYAPVFLQLLTISFAVILIPTVLFHHQGFALVCLYQTIYLQTKYLCCTHWNRLAEERRVMGSFVVATKEDLQAWNDICAICLGNMTRARRTPCGHLFHTECLRRCIKASVNCPLCKTNIK